LRRGEMKTIRIERLSNDLFAHIPHCPKCGGERKLIGYYDHYFFHEVNKAPSFTKCFKCNQEYGFKWELVNGGITVRIWDEGIEVIDHATT